MLGSIAGLIVITIIVGLIWPPGWYVVPLLGLVWFAAVYGGLVPAGIAALIAAFVIWLAASSGMMAAS